MKADRRLLDPLKPSAKADLTHITVQAYKLVIIELVNCVSGRAAAAMGEVKQQAVGIDVSSSTQTGGQPEEVMGRGSR